MDHVNLIDWFAEMKCYIKFVGFLQDLGYNGNEFSRWFTGIQSTFNDDDAIKLYYYIKSKIV